MLGKKVSSYPAASFPTDISKYFFFFDMLTETRSSIICFSNGCYLSIPCTSQSIFQILPFCNYAFLPMGIQLPKTLLKASVPDYFQCGRRSFLNFRRIYEISFDKAFRRQIARSLYTCCNMCNVSAPDFSKSSLNFVFVCCSPNTISAKLSVIIRNTLINLTQFNNISNQKIY